ncbi:MAG: hypothetical protein ACOY0R_05935, partial [Chloroflexota bacterium]
MKHTFRLTVTILVALSMMGCSVSLFAPPTSTPTATFTFTPLPTSTSTPQPTATFTPSPEPSETPVPPTPTTAVLQPTGDCPVSTDETYGYTADNPIKVGGDFLSGPQRERAYLDNLLGPNGELLSYERLGSTMGNDTILDMYEISGLDNPVVLYVDMYKYETLSAPVGFACSGPFITAP